MGKIWTAIGLMSGTSMDGIDVALVRSDGEGHVERGASQFFAYDPAMRDLLGDALETAKEITNRTERPGNLQQVEQEVTRLHVDAVKGFMESQDLSVEAVDMIGFHGQTVLHRPGIGLTVQLGDGDLLASETGIPVVYDMRANDMKFGGQGAPLVPVYHQALASSLPEELREKMPVVFVNIGGISNITYIGADDELIAFDTGPGNALIDQWVQAHAGIPFDQGGMIAAEGQVIRGLVDRYLDDPYFAKKVPKSLDRNDFRMPDPSEASLEDGAKSLANLSAAAIFKACEHLPDMPKLWIICGGGRHNPAIMADLKEMGDAMEADVVSAEDAGFDGDAMEAEAFGYLAIRAKLGLPLTFPDTTGVREPVSGGILRN
ncbi:MAG: anhydro-N-acetylmuramic acid kinase [Rhizobiaceae bacterium]